MFDSKYYTVEGRKYVRVTEVLGVISKPALLGFYGWQERKYILAQLSEALKQGLGLKEVVEQYPEIMGKQLGAAKVSSASKNIGSSLHGAIEDYLNGHKVVGLPSQDKEMFKQWLAWWKKAKLEPLDIETTVYHEGLGYAGTMDLRAKEKRKGGRILVCDWKTSNAIYKEYKLQITAYRKAAEQMKMHSDGGLIVRIPKDGSRVQPVECDFEDAPMLVFEQALGLWRWVNASELAEAA